jgi:outer membrane beta-barrel protein
MENWARNLFLNAAGIGLAACMSIGLGNPALAAENTARKQEQVIQPEIKRRKVDLTKIDKQDFSIGLYTGLMNVEDFDVNPVVGIRLDYHLSEKFFLQGAIGGTSVDRTTFERIYNVSLLTDDQRDLIYYNISLGYNLLPGEAFISKKRALNTAFYLIGGIGSTDFAGDNRFTVNMGAGYRMLINNWVTMDVGIRDHIFDIDIQGQNKATHNVEATIGFGFFF